MTRKKSKKIKSKKVGGMKLLASGTHGHIYETEDHQVIKQFLNYKYTHPSLCNRVKPSIESRCDEVDYEFKVQQIIQQMFDREEFLIKVPNSSLFRLTELGKKCEYKMDRIYPVDDYLLYVDMTFPEGQREGQNSISKTYGFMDIATLLQMSPYELAFTIGEMFSLLHFTLNLDGYDCELLVGKTNDMGLYLIDFDKVSCFTYELGQTLIRKITESDYTERVISNYTQLARFLFGSLISMSLLPTDKELKTSFLDGYIKHIDDKVPPELVTQLISIIMEYEH